MGPAGAVTFHSVFTRAVGTQRPTLTPATMPSLDWPRARLQAIAIGTTSDRASARGNGRGPHQPRRCAFFAHKRCTTTTVRALRSLCGATSGGPRDNSYISRLALAQPLVVGHCGSLSMGQTNPRCAGQRPSGGVTRSCKPPTMPCAFTHGRRRHHTTHSSKQVHPHARVHVRIAWPLCADGRVPKSAWARATTCAMHQFLLGSGITGARIAPPYCA